MLDDKFKLLDGFCSIPDISECYNIIITNYTMPLASDNTRIEIYLNKIGEQNNILGKNKMLSWSSSTWETETSWKQPSKHIEWLDGKNTSKLEIIKVISVH